MLFTYKAKIKNIEGTFTDAILAECDSDAIAFLISEWMNADSYERNLEEVKELSEDQKVIALMKKVKESEADDIFLVSLVKVLKD